MKTRNLTILSAVLALTTASAALAAPQPSATSPTLAALAKIEAEQKACLDNPDNQSTYGMNMCADAAYDAADKLLNVNYRRIVADLRKPSRDEYSRDYSSQTLARLVASQRAWVKFREANAQLQGIQMLGGSGESQVVIGSLYATTVERIKELNDLLGDGAQH